MSCSSSSNIRSSLVTTVITQEGDGNRVAFKLYHPGDMANDPGITGGRVIRWDTTQGWTLSSAHEASSSEVVGVVESVQIQAGATQFTVVASGLISYPGMSDVINKYDGSDLSCTAEDSAKDGGQGGDDILFLSDGCPGKLQYIEPTIPGHIVKPVIQRVSAGKGLYNGIVLNYIGYEVADVATVQLLQSTPPGDIKKVPENLIPESGELQGFIKVSTEQKVNTVEYPELFEKFDVNSGPYEETIKLSETVPSLNFYVNSTVVQTNPYGNILSSGKVTKVNTSTNEITISKDFGQPKIDASKNIRLGTVRVGVQSSDVSAFTLPAVPEEKTRYITKDKTEEVTLIPFMRTTQELGAVSIPKTVVVEQLETDAVISNGVNVNTKLTDLETRLLNIEKRLG
jgi:hypothetical protein